MESYVIKHSDGGYLRKGAQGQWMRTSQEEQAERMSYEKANNVLRNCISPKFRQCWEIMLMDEEETLQMKSTAEPVEGFDWEEISRSQFRLYGDLVQYGKELSAKLREVDLEICDIHHYMEFFSLDAAKGYKAYKMLRERLKRRRYIKDEMEKVNCFLACASGDFSSGKFENQLKSMDLRQYTPRILCELFGLENDGSALPHVS